MLQYIKYKICQGKKLRVVNIHSIYIRLGVTKRNQQASVREFSNTRNKTVSNRSLYLVYPLMSSELWFKPLLLYYSKLWLLCPTLCVVLPARWSRDFTCLFTTQARRILSFMVFYICNILCRYFLSQLRNTT